MPHFRPHDAAEVVAPAHLPRDSGRRKLIAYIRKCAAAIDDTAAAEDGDSLMLPR